MPDNQNSQSTNQPISRPEGHLLDWFDSRHPDSSTGANGLGSSPTSQEDMLAVYKCLDFIEQVWPTPDDDQPTAGPFLLEEEIGSGGMGKVWSATQHEPVKRRVAVKLIKPGPQSGTMIRRFESERNILASMNHPGIATLIDAGKTDDGQLYFAMELVDGPHLIHYCDRNRLNLRARLDLFLHACAAVQHAHQNGIIHRDLKPTNILVGRVDGEPRLKVIDFGLSKSESTSIEADHDSTPAMTPAATDATQHGQVLGSVRYMSPEQAAGEVASINVRSDIYSLGIVLFKLLTDSIPMDTRPQDTTPEQVLTSIQFATDPTPSETLEGLEDSRLDDVVSNRQTSDKALRHALKFDLDWIVMRAIEKAPADRYATVTEFADDIRRFLHDEPVLARPKSKRYQLRKELSRNRVLWTSVAGVILALLSGIAISGYGLVSANSARKLAENRLEHSRKSNEILADIFSDLDVYAVERETEPFKVVVGRKLVDAANQLDVESLGDPVEVAKLQIKLANALIGLERFEEAVPVCEEAFEIANEFAEEKDLKFQAGTALVKSLRGAAKTSEAREILHPMLEASRSEDGEGSEAFLELLQLEGMIARSDYRFEYARDCFQQVVAGRETLFEASDLRTLDAKYCLADVHYEQGVAQSGIPLYEEVLANYRTLLPSGHPRTIKTLLNYAGMLSDSGKFAPAIELAREGLELAKSTYGENNAATYDAKLSVGLITHRKGSHREGVRLIEEAWLGLSETTGLRHPRAITARRVLASISRQAGDFRRAIGLTEEVLALGQTDRGIQFQLAGLYNEVGEYEKARSLTQAAMEKIGEAPTGDQRLANGYHQIGRSFAAEGKFPESIVAFQKSLDSVPTRFPKHDFPVMRSTLSLASSMSKNGDADEAIAIIEDYLATMPESMDSKNLVRISCRAELGLVLRKANRTEEAVEVLESVLNSGVIPFNRGALLRELHLAKIDLGKRDAALESVDHELNVLRKQFSQDSFFLSKRLNEIGYDLIDYEMPAKAREVLAESVSVLEVQHPNSWKLESTKFDLARLVLEHEPANSEPGQLAALELEESWHRLEEMLNEAFPVEKKGLAKSINTVIEIFQNESDDGSVSIWRDRLKKL